MDKTVILVHVNLTKQNKMFVWWVMLLV